MIEIGVWPPYSELEGRWRRLQELMSHDGLDGGLFFQNADLIYLAGTTQVEAVFLPRDGEPLLLAKPPLDRPAKEAPWAELRLMPRGPALKELLQSHAEGRLGVLGLELDVLPVTYYQRLVRDQLPGLTIEDISPAIRRVRSVKTTYEIDRMRTAGLAQNQIYQAACSLFRTGMTEVEFEASLIGLARARGHQGLIRLRGFNQELFFGHLLSGGNGLIPSKVNSPTGGSGVGPGFGQGAGLRVIGPQELVSVDLCGALDGYIVDQARLFFTGRPSDIIKKTFAGLRSLHLELIDRLRPGAVTGDLFASSFELADKYGLAERFMGWDDVRCPFIGHGVGLELDDWPVVAKGARETLVAGMTIALEPRVFLPGVGVIGLEDTVLVTESEPEFLTVTDREIVEIQV